METVERRPRIPTCAHDVYCQEGKDVCIMLCTYDGYCFLEQAFLEFGHNKYLKTPQCANIVRQKKRKKEKGDE
jgi:hypothetical protein